jgi:hypothetical protein
MISPKTVDLMELACKAMNKTYKDICVCELGNQLVKWDKSGTGKNYLLEREIIEHVSIDLNGQNGALKIDLSKPITQWKNYFDILTNYGTTEHVNGQYEVFQNIHNLIKVNGCSTHAVPIVGGWARHCNVHYEKSFFEELSKVMKYEIVYCDTRIIEGRWKHQSDIDKTLVCAVLMKKEDSVFISKDEFTNLKGLEIK